jgi:hypothetical protein
MVLASIQPVIEMSTRNLPEVKRWFAREVHNLSAIYEPIG